MFEKNILKILKNNFETVCTFEFNSAYGVGNTTAYVDCDLIATGICDELFYDDFNKVHYEVVNYIKNLKEFNGCFLKAIY